MTLRLFRNVRGDKKQGHTGQGTHGTRTHCAALAFGDAVFAGLKRPSPKTDKEPKVEGGLKEMGRGKKGQRLANVCDLCIIYAKRRNTTTI